MSRKPSGSLVGVKKGIVRSPASPAALARPSALLDTRIIYCGDCLDQSQKLPDACIELIYVDPPLSSNRNYGVFRGETTEKRAFEDRHACTAACTDYIRPRCVEFARVLKKTGGFCPQCEWRPFRVGEHMLLDPEDWAI